MAIFWLIAGFVLLFFSGDWLIKGSVALSRHFKISTLGHWSHCGGFWYFCS
jgi:cation:H+ antiporter